MVISDGEVQILTIIIINSLSIGKDKWDLNSGHFRQTVLGKLVDDHEDVKRKSTPLNVMPRNQNTFYVRNFNYSKLR